MPKPDGQVTPPAETDDFGYGEVTPPAASAAIPPPVTPPVTKEEVVKPATGYSKEETPPVVPPPVTSPVEPTKEEKELSDIVKELPDSFDKEVITKFASENKLTKEQLQAYTKLAKDEQVKSEDAQKAAIAATHTQWKTELKTDPEFGGENFDKNVDRVEKVLDNYMPNMKKKLTESGGVLPPYIMRDFLALSKLLNPTTTLVTGDPSGTKEEKNFLDEMYS